MQKKKRESICLPATLHQLCRGKKRGDVVRTGGGKLSDGQQERLNNVQTHNGEGKGKAEAGESGESIY